jgi:hypothetical protein
LLSVGESEDHFNRFRDEGLMRALQTTLPASPAEGGPPPGEWFESKRIVGR